MTYFYWVQKHGLRALPTAFYPNKSGTTLTTHRLAENVAFTGKCFAYDALDRLNQICAYVPVHLIYGDNNDMLWVVANIFWPSQRISLLRKVIMWYSDREVQDSLINEREGRVFASVTRLEDVGHLVRSQSVTIVSFSYWYLICKVPQQAPTQLAVAILAVLTNSPEVKPVLSKLWWVLCVHRHSFLNSTYKYRDVNSKLFKYIFECLTTVHWD